MLRVVEKKSYFAFEATYWQHATARAPTQQQEATTLLEIAVITQQLAEEADRRG